MKRTLRSPLMIEQVKAMMDVDTILEDHSYWMGFVDALAAIGALTHTGYEKLIAHIKEVSDQVYCPLEEPEIIASPEEVLKAITNKYPAALTNDIDFDFLEERNEKDTSPSSDDSNVDPA